ncbi:delta-like protein 1 isoform X2 [Acanthaster planci]|uniref:Delta-like protein 1 isoform X2 n=1 Tax=Acanthaster planci TaxID=133434 RepID=A0A8B7ZY12_ACAPL|nr:delta-like protein 1 isoform X2 [Acanthaster planci]
MPSLPCESGPCRNGGTCQNVGASYRCDCPTGYQGQTCETIVDCSASNPCDNGGTCDADGRCTCPIGVTGNRCQTTDNKVPNHCENNPCKNGGTCLNREEQFSCACKPGYTGQTCTSTTIDPNKNGQTGLSLEIWWIALIALIGLLLIIIVIAVLFTVCRSSQPDEAHIVGNRKEYP